MPKVSVRTTDARSARIGIVSMSVPSRSQSRTEGRGSPTRRRGTGETRGSASDWADVGPSMGAERSATGGPPWRPSHQRPKYLKFLKGDGGEGGRLSEFH